MLHERLKGKRERKKEKGKIELGDGVINTWLHQGLNILFVNTDIIISLVYRGPYFKIVELIRYGLLCVRMESLFWNCDKLKYFIPQDTSKIQVDLRKELRTESIQYPTQSTQAYCDDIQGDVHTPTGEIMYCTNDNALAIKCGT
ncbi:hypothetical protein CAPTEDRAFT_213412 [Capitella teleta]|uniref:Uncharacterized protein n=1 Tax=Capitella teleta TaxID=283909 RepID=R7UPI8_CAPTE|nr:hypothetical protein CAPTEDRAFT_213412 [Capitella teleta]|eukprot:ELU08075.1 hypothetical protein CAPTEDRAFT_213412 [Capitella teleta]